MKDTPEIAPELRGLLEEIVADPRSSMRLAPRRALRSWFDSGETIRPREVATTRAERHLLDEHRESLAELLCEASRIAFWKEPVLSHRPLVDGALLDPAVEELSWRPRARRRATRGDAESTSLLRACLGGIQAPQGRALATAAFSLVPSTDARLCLASHAVAESPRRALDLFTRTAALAGNGSSEGLAWAGVGCSSAMLGDLDEAKRAYTACRESWPLAWFNLFNVACVQERAQDAVACSTVMAELGAPDSLLVDEACRTFSEWARETSASQLASARNTARRIEDDLTETAKRFCDVYALG